MFLGCGPYKAKPAGDGVHVYLEDEKGESKLIVTKENYERLKKRWPEHYR